MKFCQKNDEEQIKAEREDSEMTIRGVGQNYDYFGRTANATQRRTTVRETIAKAGKQPVNLSISEEGRDLCGKWPANFSLLPMKSVFVK